MSVHKWIRARLHLSAGLHEHDPELAARAHKRAEEFFGKGGVLEEVVKHARARKILGTFRYEQKVNGQSYEQRARQGTAKTYIQRAKEKIDLYDRTGNTEYIVDAFNYMLLEWAEPYHPDAHFKPTDRNPEPGTDQ